MTDPNSLPKQPGQNPDDIGTHFLKPEAELQLLVGNMRYLLGTDSNGDSVGKTSPVGSDEELKAARKSVWAAYREVLDQQKPGDESKKTP